MRVGGYYSSNDADLSSLILNQKVHRFDGACTPTNDRTPLSFDVFATQL